MTEREFLKIMRKCPKFKLTRDWQSYNKGQLWWQNGEKHAVLLGLQQSLFLVHHKI